LTHTLNLTDCTADLALQVGGKAVGLGHLLRQARDVPPGFVVTTNAYREWLAAHALDERIERLLAGATGLAALEAAAQHIQALFEGAELPDELAAEIDQAYSRLDYGAGDVLVAVRSSATAEDQADASFAGQQETYLGVRGQASVRRHVARCWASLFTPQAISYRQHLAIPNREVAMAVVVQRMVEAEAAGVMMTIDPVTGDRSQISIDATVGLGQPLVGGEVNPDHWSVDKVTLEVRHRAISEKAVADRLDVTTGGVRRDHLNPEERVRPSLSDEEAVAVAALGKQVERAMGRAMDVEWAIGPGPRGPRHLYLLQARPETVWSSRQLAPVAAPATTALDRILASMLPSGMRNKEGTR
jgi:pyruvate,water dikinase